MAHVKNLDLKKVTLADYSRARIATNEILDDVARFRSFGLTLEEMLLLAKISQGVTYIRRYLDGE